MTTDSKMNKNGYDDLKQLQLEMTDLFSSHHLFSLTLKQLKLLQFNPQCLHHCVPEPAC